MYYRSPLVSNRFDPMQDGFASLLAAVVNTPAKLRQADEIAADRRERRELDDRSRQDTLDWRNLQRKDAQDQTAQRLAEELAGQGEDVSWFQGPAAQALAARSKTVATKRTRDEQQTADDRKWKRLGLAMDLAKNRVDAGGDLGLTPEQQAQVSRLVADQEEERVIKEDDRQRKAKAEQDAAAAINSWRQAQAGKAEAEATLDRAKSGATNIKGTLGLALAQELGLAPRAGNGTHGGKPTAANLKAVHELAASEAVANGAAHYDENSGKLIVDDAQAYNEILQGSYNAHGVSIPQWSGQTVDKATFDKVSKALDTYHNDRSWFFNKKGDRSLFDGIDPAVIERVAKRKGMMAPGQSAAPATTASPAADAGWVDAEPDAPAVTPARVPDRTTETANLMSQFPGFGFRPGAPSAPAAPAPVATPRREGVSWSSVRRDPQFQGLSDEQLKQAIAATGRAILP